MPSLTLLGTYLRILGLDFLDLQDALDQIQGRAPKPVQDGLSSLDQQVAELERFEAGDGRS